MVIDFGIEPRFESGDFGVQPVKEPIDLLIEGDKPRIDHFEPSLEGNKPRIDHFEPSIHLITQAVHLAAKFANVGSKVGDGSGVVPSPSFQRRDALV